MTLPIIGYAQVENLVLSIEAGLKIGVTIGLFSAAMKQGVDESLPQTKHGIAENALVDLWESEANAVFQVGLQAVYFIEACAGYSLGQQGDASELSGSP